MTGPRPTRPGPTLRADAGADAVDARLKRSAWLLGSLALALYVGYIAYYFWRSAAGG